MTLSDLTIDRIKDIIAGDVGGTPRLKGADILKLFNTVGFKDIYKYDQGGMPDGVSRVKYVENKLYEINGTVKIKTLLENVFDPRHFALDSKLNLDKSVEQFNPLIEQDGYRLEKIESKYTVIGANLPDEIEVEIHFEDIQNQILSQIRQAKFTIWVAVAWFTDKILFDELVKKKREGVNVQIIVFDDDINKQWGQPYESQFETYRRVPTGRYQNIMHHKFCVIDLKTVIHGSYNWTTKARWNKETISIDNSKELAEKFAKEFIVLKT